MFDRRLSKIIASLIGLVAASSLLAQENPDWMVDAPPMSWLAENTPFGMDITPDGQVWINVHEIGQTADYAIRAKDVFEAEGQHPTAWVRGFHLRDKDVPFRETKTYYSADCKAQTLWQLRWVAYDADGNVFASQGSGSRDYVVPGSLGETYVKLLCRRN